MNNLTILFYTANRIPDNIMIPVITDLQKHNIPIISITQEAMSLGENIVVPKEYSVKNIYKQVLIGAKAACTEFVALCEDDCFYQKEHFEFRPLHFAYNANRWLLHLRERIFSYRDRPVLSQCIAKRESLINTLEERLALKELPDNLCGEPGRLEKRLGISEYPYSMFCTVDKPNLVVCHSWGIMGHKLPGDRCCTYVEGLGDICDWMGKFKC
jgi:hypothetical protein